MSSQAPKSVRPARTVLAVDDDEATRAIIVRWLTMAKLTCLEAGDGESAIALASSHASSLDAIVLDVMMPGIDGYETLRRLKQIPETAAIPVVLLTAHANDDADIVRGVEHGAVDHVSKPFSGPVLVAKVRALCDRARAERELRSKLVRAEANATIDSLTQLGNRRSFDLRLREEAAHATRHQQPLSLVLLDLDHFKSINDTFGHAEGDRVLCEVAEAMRHVVRAEDCTFRYGGEEMAFLLRACDAAGAAAVATRLQQVLRERAIQLGDPPEPRVVTFSAGVASADASNDFSTADLISRADAALYRAKRAGRDRVEIT